MTTHIEKHMAIGSLLKKFVKTEEQWNEKAKKIREILDAPGPSDRKEKVKTEDQPEKPPVTRNRREKGGIVRGDSE